MKYRITIDEVEIDYTGTGHYERTNTREIYQQTVENLDVASVIAVVNNLTKLPDA